MIDEKFINLFMMDLFITIVALIVFVFTIGNDNQPIKFMKIGMTLLIFVFITGPAFLDANRMLNRDYEYITGEVKTKMALKTTYRDPLKIYDESTGKTIKLTVSFAEAEYGSIVTVAYLPHTKYGKIVAKEAPSTDDQGPTGSIGNERQ